MSLANVPRVFVSYSYDSDSHKAWVRKLSEVLRNKGIDIILDQWDLSLGSDLTRFMESGLTHADRVLLICTANYVKKANGGAGYEKMIVSAEIFREQTTAKFIPVVRGDHVPKLPSFLSSRVYIDFTDDHLFVARCDELLRELHRVPAFPKPALGKNPFALLSLEDVLEHVLLRIDRRGVPRDLSEDFVRYCRLRTREGSSLFFDTDIDKDALAQAIWVPESCTRSDQA
jgi:hypothetical protein